MRSGTPGIASGNGHPVGSHYIQMGHFSFNRCLTSSAAKMKEKTKLWCLLLAKYMQNFRLIRFILCEIYFFSKTYPEDIVV